MKNVVGIIFGLFVIALVAIQSEMGGITEPATMTVLGTGMAVVASLARRHYRSKQERANMLQPFDITK